MAARLSILRVGALAALVGQACFDKSAPPAVAPTLPDLVLAPLDAGADARGNPAPDEVRFGHPLPVAGDAWTVHVEATSLSSEQLSTYESTYRVEILAVDGPVPSRVKLRFERNVHAYQGQETPTSIHGKEYVVDARAPHVREAASASPAPAEEAQRVLDVFPDLGTRARIDEVLPDEAMRIGDHRDELADAVLRVIHPRAWTLRAGSARLVRLERNERAADDHAVLALSLDATSESGLHMNVAGEARVRLADARLESLSLDGAYDVTKAGAEVKGTFALRRRVTSDRAPRSGR